MSKRFLDQDEVQWQKESVSRLNYDMIFDSSPDMDESEELRQQNDELENKLAEQEKKWQARLRKMEVEAFEKGFQKGKVTGKTEAEAEIDQKLLGIEEILKTAHEEWNEVQTLLEPGILDLSFEIAEEILKLPLEHEELRERLSEELHSLLQKMDDGSKAAIHVSRSDYEMINSLVEEYRNRLTVHLTMVEDCNPGEFKFETKRETIVKDFKLQLQDFKDALNLPSWNE
jgi:flagellar biosynthesis/type III secretory pathway protein FliH